MCIKVRGGEKPESRKGKYIIKWVEKIDWNDG